VTDPIGAEALQHNPSLEPLACLIGEWRTTATHPMAPGVTFHGRTSFTWHLGGAFVLVRSEVDEPGIPSGLALIGSDDDARTLTMIYFDERGVSRRYAVEVAEDQITWHRDEGGFAQRMTISPSADNDRLEATGTMSRDGGPWEDDLQTSYERIDV